MRKKILSASAALLLLVAGKTVSAQWDNSTPPKLYTNPTNQMVGIGHNNPLVALDVNGVANIWSNYRWAAVNGKMQPGSLTIGNLNASFGNSTAGWGTNNVAGLLMETMGTTEIAVHHSGTRLASMIQYDHNNRLTLGRNMGWGTISYISMNGKVGIGNATPDHELVVNGEILVDGPYNYLAFRANPANTHGEWAIEYAVNEGGMNFWKPWPTPGSNNYFLFLKDNGNIGIGTSTPSYKLDVCGTIRGKELRVETGWCDYVFEPDYKLMPLNEVEKYIQENKHLPEIPSEAVVESEGLAVGEMQALHMKKIEELTLYIIELNKKIGQLETQVKTLSDK